MSSQNPHAIRGVLGRASLFLVLGAPTGLVAQSPRTPLTFAEVVQRLERSSPMLGEHNRSIFVDRLGLSPQEYDRLVAEGAIR